MYTPEYEKLLNKYCVDKDIFDLIEHCILADFGEREDFYNNHKKYPEQRDRLMKLKSDLANQIYKISKGGNR